MEFVPFEFCAEVASSIRYCYDLSKLSSDARFWEEAFREQAENQVHVALHFTFQKNQWYFESLSMAKESALSIEQLKNIDFEHLRIGCISISDQFKSSKKPCSMKSHYIDQNQSPESFEEILGVAEHTSPAVCNATLQLPSSILPNPNNLQSLLSLYEQRSFWQISAPNNSVYEDFLTSQLQKSQTLRVVQIRVGRTDHPLSTKFTREIQDFALTRKFDFVDCPEMRFDVEFFRKLVDVPCEEIKVFTGASFLEEDELHAFLIEREARDLPFGGVDWRREDGGRVSYTQTERDCDSIRFVAIRK